MVIHLLLRGDEGARNVQNVKDPAITPLAIDTGKRR